VFFYLHYSQPIVLLVSATKHIMKKEVREVVDSSSRSWEKAMKKRRKAKQRQLDRKKAQF